MAKFFQDHMWQDSIFAIKLSCKISDFDLFYSQLIEKMPQNSAETRRQSANTIARRFFPKKSLNQPTRQTWQIYKDENLLQHLMRYQFLMSEPVIADFAKLQVFSHEPGESLEFRKLADRFIEQTYGEVKPKLRNKLSGALQATGLLTRVKGIMYVRELLDLERAFGVLLHLLFAPQPTTIAVKDILNHVFWRYLGVRSPSDVVKLLRWLEARKIILKYVRADQLEQVTTAYSADEILNNKTLL
jgi:hypothetical protein